MLVIERVEAAFSSAMGFEVRGSAPTTARAVLFREVVLLLESGHDLTWKGSTVVSEVEIGVWILGADDTTCTTGVTQDAVVQVG